MPRQAEWLQRLPESLEVLRALEAPVVDRAMLQQLLGIHRRQAIRLMHRFGGYQSGRTFLIMREDLIAALEAAAENGSFEIGRRERLGEKLEEMRREAKAHKVKIPVAPDVWGREVAGLPSTVKLSPGRLEIACTDATDMLRQLMELAQAVSNDYETFEARLKGKDGR